METFLKKPTVLGCFLFILIPCMDIPDAWGDVHSIAAAIRQEATLSNHSELGHPLPLAAHWNTGWHVSSYAPNYQLSLIEAGHYLLPSFYLPPQWEYRANVYGYYENGLKKVAQLNLPICFISTQWESYLTRLEDYFSLPVETNPNVVDINGIISKKVSPFGPASLWRDAGQKWTATPLIQKLKEWYPSPPLVIFLSNNEHDKLQWYEVETSVRYLKMHGTTRDDNFKRKVVGDGWIERYRSLQQGMLKGIEASQWQVSPRFVGYNAFGPRAFGRWNGWINYSLYSPGRLDPWVLAWDGASLSYYVHNWGGNTDYTVMSPQIEAMNWVFMRDEAWRLNPNYWLELSTWDGYEPARDDDKRKHYASLGQEFNPSRYEGYVQFGMWLLRPRVVREFRGNNSDFADDEPYFLSVLRAVDRVHTNPTLKSFWRKGRLVINDSHQHPYQQDVPSEYASIQRWFLLDTGLDPKRPWDLSTSIPVFSIAFVIGDAPEREWLVYAHSPLKQYTDVSITVPGYGITNISVTPSGTFYHINEKAKTIKPVVQLQPLQILN